MSLFNPFCKCLNPQRIVNPYTNEAMTVPCGHCKACILAKNSRYAFQCDLESYSSKHTLFITLTYANRFIPCAQFVDSIERPYGHDLVDVETGEVSDQSDLYHLAQYFFEPEIVNYSLDSIEMCRYIHRVYTELLLSKHFLYFVCDRPTLSEQKRKLKLIEEFYSRLDYMHLKTFFENQQLFYESDLVGDLDLMSDALS